MKLSSSNAIKLAFAQKGVDSTFSYKDAVGSSVLALLLYLGIGGSIINLLRIPLSTTISVLLGVVIIATEAFVLKRSKQKLYALCGVITFFILLWIVLSSYAQSGLAITANSISSIFDIEFLKINASFEENIDPSLRIAATTIFILPFAAFLAIFCSFLSKCPSSIAAVFILVLILALCTLESVNKTGSASTLSLAVLSISVVLFVVRALSASSAIAEKGGILIPTVAILAASAIVGFAFVNILPDSFLKPLDNFLNSQNYFLTNVLPHSRYTFGSKDSLPIGNFSAIRGPEYTPETTIVVDMEKPEPNYLRGFIGEVYTNQGWKSLSKSLLLSTSQTDTQDYKRLFYNLHQNGFYPQTQLASLAKILDPTLAEEEYTISIENQRGNRIQLYTPYELSSADEELLSAQFIRTTSLINNGFFGDKEYTYKALPNQISRHSEIAAEFESQSASPSPQLQNYIDQEKSYRRFVYNNYLDLEETDSQLLQRYLGEGAVAGESHLDYISAKTNILAFLSRQLEYVDEPTSFNGDDFLRFVIRETQSGSTVHYATVATLAFRHFGIPARYVEGYLIPADFAEMAADLQEEILLTDAESHAWVEYYHDGIGWIPFESDPNYLDQISGLSPPPNSSSTDASPEPEDPGTPPKRDPKDDEDPVKNFWAKLLPLLIGVLLVMAAVALWLGSRYKILERRNKNCNDPNPNIAINHLLSYLILIWKDLEIVSSVDSVEEIGSQVLKKWGEHDSYWRKTPSTFVAIYQKSKFSSSSATKEDCQELRQILEKAIEYVNANNSKKDIFILRYIKFLY